MSVLCLIGGAPFIPAWLMISALTEIIRLAAEKGSMLFSAVWQRLPHRRLARCCVVCRATSITMLAPLTIVLPASMHVLMPVLRPIKTPRAAVLLSRISRVPDRFALRTGVVRDVATGEIFIHRAGSMIPGC